MHNKSSMYNQIICKDIIDSKIVDEHDPYKNNTN